MYTCVLPCTEFKMQVSYELQVSTEPIITPTKTCGGHFNAVFVSYALEFYVDRQIKEVMHRPGIEPGSVLCQGNILAVCMLKERKEVC